MQLVASVTAGVNYGISGRAHCGRGFSCTTPSLRVLNIAHLHHTKTSNDRIKAHSLAWLEVHSYHSNGQRTWRLLATGAHWIRLIPIMFLETLTWFNKRLLFLLFFTFTLGPWCISVARAPFVLIATWTPENEYSSHQSTLSLNICCGTRRLSPKHRTQAYLLCDECI